MVDSKLLKSDYFSPTKPEVYRLPQTTGLKEYNFAHEKLCGDLYVAFNPDWWTAPMEADDFGIKPDRIMIHFGKRVFWEVDRGTEDLSVIRTKVERYIELSQSDPTKRFHVIFTTTNNKQSAESRCEALLNLFTRYQRGNQFLTTTNEWACKFPDGAAFVSPIALEGATIELA